MLGRQRETVDQMISNGRMINALELCVVDPDWPVKSEIDVESREIMHS